MLTMSKEIIEGNKLIAEFMGCENNESEKIFKWLVNGAMWADEGLKYHLWWAWLMPVVEKINKIHDTESDEWPVTPLYGDVYDPYTFFDLRITESINSVYRHVIAFITWYNQQNT